MWGGGDENVPWLAAHNEETFRDENGGSLPIPHAKISDYHL
jgi:hypothetical protein